MGLVIDVPLTTDADLLKYAFEQQIQNLLRSGTGNTYAQLHQGAVNDLMRRLRGRSGYTDAQLAAISNTEDLKPILVSWVLAQIFGGLGGANVAARELSAGKASFYALRVEDLFKTTVVVIPNEAIGGEERTLPVLVNVECGTSFPALGSRPGPTVPFGRPGSVAQKIAGGAPTLFIEGE